MINPYIQTLLTAMIPIGELRLAIPVALASLDMTVPQAYIISIIGNLIPVIFLLLFLESVSRLLSKRSESFDKFFLWLFARTRRRFENKYHAYGYIALVLFVAIPLPITGAWTGSAAAYLLGIPFGKAFALIALGVALSGIIVTLASLGIISVII